MIIAQYLDKASGRESTVTWNVKRGQYYVTMFDIDTGRYLEPVYRFDNKRAADATARTIIQQAVIS